MNSVMKRIVTVATTNVTKLVTISTSGLVAPRALDAPFPLRAVRTRSTMW